MWNPSLKTKNPKGQTVVSRGPGAKGALDQESFTLGPHFPLRVFAEGAEGLQGSVTLAPAPCSAWPHTPDSVISDPSARKGSTAKGRKMFGNLTDPVSEVIGGDQRGCVSGLRSHS